MQTTLLGLAIALILALVAALVGPHFVDWSRYRTEFETQASRMTGTSSPCALRVRCTSEAAVSAETGVPRRQLYAPTPLPEAEGPGSGGGAGHQGELEDP